jgi:hypothetical protein
VDEDVQTAECLPCGGDRGAARGGVAQVGGAAVLDAVRRARRIQVDDGDARAGLQEPRDERGADGARAAGHQDPPAFEAQPLSRHAAPPGGWSAR